MLCASILSFETPEKWRKNIGDVRLLKRLEDTVSKIKIIGKYSG
jgi:hypothetical protein